MSDDEIIAQVPKLNSDDDNSESGEVEVIETSKINNSDNFECFGKRLCGWSRLPLILQNMLLKQLQDRAAKRH